VDPIHRDRSLPARVTKEFYNSRFFSVDSQTSKNRMHLDVSPFLWGESFTPINQQPQKP